MFFVNTYFSKFDKQLNKQQIIFCFKTFYNFKIAIHNIIEIFYLNYLLMKKKQYKFMEQYFKFTLKF